MTTLEKARATFSSDRYATDVTGITIENIGQHEALCTLALDNRHYNARGVAMGGVLFTLADFAAAVAANSEDLDSDCLPWVSLNSTIHFLAPGSGLLKASCKAVKHGRTTALYITTITAGEGTEKARNIAVIETTMLRAIPIQ